MKEMIANSLIAVGVVGLILTLFDIFLSERHKTALNNGLLRAWSFLDDMRRIRLRQKLRAWKANVFIPIFAALSVFGFAIWILANPLAPPITLGSGAVVFTGAAICWVLNRLNISFALRQSNLLKAVAVASAFAAISSLPFLLMLISGNALAQRLVPVDGNVDLVQMLFVLFYVSSSFITFALLIGWLSIALPLAIIVVLQISVSFLEFVLRRFAEYSKGPLLALSTISTGLGTMLKALS